MTMLPLFRCLGSILLVCGLTSSIHFSCSFLLQQKKVIYNRTADESSIPHSPSIVWSHLGEWVTSRLSQLQQPSYPSHVVVELERAQINFQAGTIFDDRGCISTHSMSAQDWRQRQKYMRSIPAQALHNDTVFDFADGVFLWGSMYAADYQHSVIDFLPLFDTLLASGVMQRHPHIPIIVGPYIKFYESLYPFNLFTYIRRDYQYKQQGGGIPVPKTFQRVFYVDQINRDQSYVLPGSYDRLLPFLRSDFIYDPAVHNMDYLVRYLANFNETSTSTDRVHVAAVENKSSGVSTLSARINSRNGNDSGTLDTTDKRRLAVGRGSRDNMVQLSHNSGRKDGSNGKQHSKVQQLQQEKKAGSVSFKSKNSTALNVSGDHRQWVVYLDRSGLANNPAYIKTSGLVNGRSVVNQTALLTAIESALKPEYRLVVHACTDWRTDRDIVRHAAVLMGPHGGHFTNMIFAEGGTHVVEFGRSVLMRVVDQEITAQNAATAATAASGTEAASVKTTQHNKSNNRNNKSNSNSSSNNKATSVGRSVSKHTNARWVFVGMSNALGHNHWAVEDELAVRAVRANRQARLRWADNDMVVSIRQVVDTLRAIGVVAK